MTVEISLFAEVLVIATTLLAGVKIQGLLEALQRMSVESRFPGVRAGSKSLRKMSRWIG